MKHEQTKDEIIRINLEMAIDQAHEYDSLAAAFDSYGQNAQDTALEGGYSADDAMDVSSSFFYLANQELSKRGLTR